MARGGPSTKLFEKSLVELVWLLHRSPATARQIAETLHCSRGTAHKRLDELKRRRLVQVSRVREGACGPKSALYALLEERRA